MKVLQKRWTHRCLCMVFIFSIIAFLIQHDTLFTLHKLRSRRANNEQVLVISRKYLVEPNSSIVSTTYITDNTNITQYIDGPPEWMQFRKDALAVFILSAIGSNQTSKRGYRKEIFLNGWEARKHRWVDKKCCVWWQTNRISSYYKPSSLYWKRSGNLPATQYTCPIKGPLINVLGVKLEFGRSKCPRDRTLYQKVEIPLQHANESIGLCSKIVYGNIDAKLLVDWMEFYREMNVDKVFMFTYNLTRQVETILDYYSSIGFLERRLYDYPWKAAGAMTRQIGRKTPSVWQDEQVTVFDCAQRLQGYTYVAIIDLDEFLLPRKHKNIIHMMRFLTKLYPTAAGFSFKSFIFVKDWEPVMSNKSDIYKYQRRTPALYTREKNIIIRQRIETGSLHTHEFLPKSGYNKTIVGEDIAAINHYRKCYSDYTSVCQNKSQQFEDTNILEVAKRFEHRTIKFDHLLGL
ncbi:hypothetical protein ACF0H5_007927 [Mactra antiquata]